MTDSTRRIDWPVIAFFTIAYFIAWGLIPVFNWMANVSGIKDGITLMALTESLDWGAFAQDLPLPAWFLYLLTRIQDFAFTIAGIIMSVIVAGRGGLALLGEKFRPGLASWRWYLSAILLPYGLFGLAAALAIAGDRAILETADFSLQTLGAILFGAQAGLFFYMILRGGLGEEPGLRGFALPRLQQRHGPIVASFIIGILWTGWHIPVYIQAELTSIVVSIVLAFSFAFLFTYFYNFARESLWIVIILHAGINAGDNAFEVLFPGLTGSGWQVPAYLGLLLSSITLSVVMWRRNRQQKLVLAAIQ